MGKGAYRGEPHSNQGLQGDLMRGAGVGRASGGSLQTRVPRFSVVFHVSIRVANWWPEAQCCPQICFDWVVLCFKEINQHFKIWRFHRKIHSEFLLLSHNTWADLALLGLGSCLATILGGAASAGGAYLFIMAPCASWSVACLAPGTWAPDCHGLFAECPASSRLSGALL